MVKTNAVRVLDRLGIKYELREYEVDPHDLSAETVAAKIGIPPEQGFKTLAVQGDRNGIYLAVISATEELDSKALARRMTGKQEGAKLLLVCRPHVQNRPLYYPARLTKAGPLRSEIRLGGRGREVLEDVASTSITSSWIAITKVFEGLCKFIFNVHHCLPNCGLSLVLNS